MAREKVKAATDANDILNEIRNLIIGSALLLGGVLAAPYAPRFPELTNAERIFYGIGLLLLIIGISALVAPSVQQHVFTRDPVITIAARPFIISGAILVYAALFMEACVIAHFVFGLATTIVFASVIISLTLFMWLIIPWLMILHHRSQQEVVH